MEEDRTSAHVTDIQGVGTFFDYRYYTNRECLIAAMKDEFDNRIYFCVDDIYHMLHDEVEYIYDKDKFLHDYHDEIKMIKTHDIDPLYNNRFGKDQIEFVSLFGMLQLLDITTYKTSITFIKWIMNTIVPCTYAHMINSVTKKSKN